MFDRVFWGTNMKGGTGKVYSSASNTVFLDLGTDKIEVFSL
jgi:hypothetical protein